MAAQYSVPSRASAALPKFVDNCSENYNIITTITLHLATFAIPHGQACIINTKLELGGGGGGH